MHLIPVKNLLIVGHLFLVLVSKSQCVNPDLEQLCTRKPADIVFILDSSSSIWPEYFKKQLNFVNYIVDHLQIGPNEDQVRIGVETFSDLAKVHLNLNNFLDKRDLKTEIKDIRQTLGNTSIGSALRMMRTKMFRSSRGARPKVRHVVILLTDGTSQDGAATQYEAKASRHANIEIYVIGIGHHISEKELRGISSRPHSKYLFLTPSYNTLDLIRKDVINKTCEDVTTYIDCSNQPTDIVFVVDTSSPNSVWREQFQKQLDLINYMVDHLDIGHGLKQIRIGVLIFGDFARIYVYFNDFKDKTELKWKINQIPQTFYGTNISDALRLLRTNVFAADIRARPNVRRIGILLTDSTSRDEAAVLREARATRQANIELLVVGTGHYIRESELRGISSRPHSKYLFLTPSYNSLDLIRKDVLNQICDQACNSYQKTEVMFLVNNNHFGKEKTRLILTVFDEIIKNRENLRNFQFGVIFDDCLPHREMLVESITEPSLADNYIRYQHHSYVKILGKLQHKLFSRQSSKVRRVGLIVLDSSIDLNSPEVASEFRRIRSENIEMYALLIGDVDERYLHNLSEGRIIRSQSYNNLIFDVPSRFSRMMCRG